MLRDSRSHALAENFASQWLQTRKLREYTPDPVLFPEFDESLRSAMLRETELFSSRSRTRIAACWTFSTRITLLSTIAWPGTTASSQSEAIIPPRLAGRHPEGRRPDAGEHPGGHVQPDSDVTGQARQVDPGEPPGCTALAAAVRRGGPQGGQGDRLVGNAPAANGAAPDRPGLCLLPPSHGPARLSGWRTSTPSAVGGRTRGITPSIHPASCPAGESSGARRSLRAALLARRDAFARCLAEKMLTYALGLRPRGGAGSSSGRTESSPGSPGTDTGSRPWCSPSSRANRSATPRSQEGSHEESRRNHAEDSPTGPRAPRSPCLGWK